MRYLLTLLISAFLVSTQVSAQSKPFSQSDQVQNGLAAMRSGDKSKAWEILFPEAKKGDVQAMYYLGDMMLRSPEYSDNLDRAMKFFAVAAAKGHAGAKEMLPRVRDIISQKASGALPTIAGTTGIASQEELDLANAKLKKYTADVLRFTDSSAIQTQIPKVEILVFIAKADAAAEKLYKITKDLDSQYGAQIKTKFFINLNPSDLNPQLPPFGGTSFPPNGFSPDFKGQFAQRHGVTNFPTVILKPLNGKEMTVDELPSLPSLLSSMLQ